MTQKQLSAAIGTLLQRCESSLEQARQYTMDAIPNSPAWTTHMTASIVLGAICDALISARDAAPKENHNAQSETRPTQL